MSTTTTNYGLIKPDTTDPILIGQLNDNADAIDAALKENADAIGNKPDAADIPAPSTAAPAMDGTAAAGTSTDYARADHVHPSDTSKQDALTAAQLAAANSGIDSAKVEQIETNKNNISKDEAALVELVDGGAKNVLEFDAIGSTTYGSTYESNGVKFTLNADNTVTFERISTSSSVANCLLILNGARLDVSSYCDGNHVLSGCPSGGSGNTYEIMATVSGGAYTKRDYGTGVILDSVSGIAPYIQLTVRSEFTGTAMFKPMICTKAAWDISQTYQPYRPSYQELYEMVKALQAN